MSVNSEEIRVKPAMLYLALRIDRWLWELCDFLEEALEATLARVPPKRRLALISIITSLKLGATRDQMIKSVEKCGYNRLYAEKLVDETLSRLRRIGARVDNTVEKGGGMLGVKYSKPNRPGRPPVMHRLAKVDVNSDLEEELMPLLGLVNSLSGSSARLSKLGLELSKLPIVREMSIKAFEEVFSVIGERKCIPDEKEKEALNKVKKAYPDEKSLSHAFFLLDELRYQMLQPISEEVEKITGVPLNDWMSLEGCFYEAKRFIRSTSKRELRSRKSGQKLEEKEKSPGERTLEEIGRSEG